MPNNIQDCIDQLIIAITELKVALNEEKVSLNEVKEDLVKENQKTEIQQTGTQPILKPISESSFEELYDLLNSEKWPEAVNKHLICDHTNPEEKLARGRGIIELMIGSDLSGKKFLDYGCGEGFSTIAAKDKDTEISIGFDIQDFPSWTSSETGLIFTTKWDKVVENGPYDIVLCFDVVDHSSHENPKNILKKIKQVLTPDGKIYLRTHPWTSRHANHFYHKINKAYIHLVFTDEELKKIDHSWGRLDPLFEPNIGVIRPIITYQNWIDDAGLSVEHMREMKEEVEQFFQNPKISKRIMQSANFDNFPQFQMSLQFIDYVLVNNV